MKNKCLLLSATILCSIHLHAGEIEDHFSHLPKGGRISLHGMVLYGSNGNYFIDHIPMESTPHDFQIISQVLLKSQNGEFIKKDFSNETFTLKPGANFSLNDYLAGKMTQFNGDIYAGGFEQGGEILDGMSSIQVSVQVLKYARQIPAQNNETQIQLSDQTNTFEMNVITPTQNFQSVKNKSTGKELWCVKGPDFFEPCQ